ITNHSAVADALSQFELASIALSKKLGGTLTDSEQLANVPATDNKKLTTGNQQDLHSLAYRATTLSNALAQLDNKTSVAKYEPNIQKLVHE
ncbi:hypothetical protein ACNQ2Q_26610, partial [Enterobacter cloacae complex sp.6701430]|uniref:hypothetical protein n=1 Tax=Enterobacter cloacae complex sp.6701430 TaxID=3397176 RepID=UPI003AAD50D3